MSRNRGRWLVGLASLWLSAHAIGCGDQASTLAFETITTPDFSAFATNAGGVHTFLERRCGTLDCHGQTGRPFRLFSMGGLRLPNDAGLLSGMGADSAMEIYANYQSLVGLQPELTTAVVDGSEPPTVLLVVAKPLALQTHKGGPVLARGDSGDLCLESWLSGKIDTRACTDATAVP
ncbi:MAG TPA: hypothetical protein VN894_20635 [Polyangiaceae bacterium]|nr:hypothetical protein [Polyangiaceae bacterium]